MSVHAVFECLNNNLKSLNNEKLKEKVRNLVFFINELCHNNIHTYIYRERERGREIIETIFCMFANSSSMSMCNMM